MPSLNFTSVSSPLIKGHPNQSIAFIQTGLQNISNNVQALRVCPEHDAFLKNLIQEADLVTGMFSSLLVESEILEVQSLGIF